LYRSKKLWKPSQGARGVFGGQIIGLSLNAATKTIDTTFVVHSLHCYFLLAGDDTVPIVFRVFEVRTGKSYASRSVLATQRGKSIFSMMASFAVPEVSRLSFQIQMPNVPSPESLTSDESRLRSLLDDPRAAKWHKSIRLRLNTPLAIETKRIPPKFFMKETSEKNKHMIWMKAKGTLPDIPAVHQCVAAYCSDHELLNSALVPFDLARYTETRAKTIKMMASLDHTIVFCRLM
jgi:acyl-CoA thioesterase II